MTESVRNVLVDPLRGWVEFRMKRMGPPVWRNMPDGVWDRVEFRTASRVRTRLVWGVLSPVYAHIKVAIQMRSRSR